MRRMCDSCLIRFYLPFVWAPWEVRVSEPTQGSLRTLRQKCVNFSTLLIKNLQQVRWQKLRQLSTIWRFHKLCAQTSVWYVSFNRAACSVIQPADERFVTMLLRFAYLWLWMRNQEIFCNADWRSRAWFFLDCFSRSGQASPSFSLLVNLCYLQRNLPFAHMKWLLLRHSPPTRCFWTQQDFWMWNHLTRHVRHLCENLLNGLTRPISKWHWGWYFLFMQFWAKCWAQSNWGRLAAWDASTHTIRLWEWDILPARSQLVCISPLLSTRFNL